MAGYVMSGALANCTIYCNSEQMFVFIKNGKNVIPLEPSTVKSYKLVQKHRLVDRLVYCIEWKEDGSKSIIAIPSSWNTYLVSGCETGRLDIDVIKRKRRNRCLVLLGILILMIVISVWAMLSHVPNKSPTPIGSYAEWDGVSDKQLAEILIQTTDAVAVGYGIPGVVSGYFYNEGDRSLRHLEAVYGLYDFDGERIGQCVFSTNDAYLKPGQRQGFTATCDNWRENIITRLESAGFRENRYEGS